MSGTPENSPPIPEYRWDFLTNRPTVLAPARGLRPVEAKETAGQDAAWLAQVRDPFLEGREERTPPELFAWREPGSQPNGPGWRVRVFPNAFPALISFARSGTPGAAGQLAPPSSSAIGVPRSLGPDVSNIPAAAVAAGATPGVGIHELIVECPHFEQRMSRLSPRNIEEVFSAYRQRILTLEQEHPSLRQTVVFKNEGTAAGASQPHCHSQLLALPFVPPLIQERVVHAAAYFQQHQHCAMCDWLDREREAGMRVVCETAELSVVCPAASRFSYETWIVPRRHASHFALATDGQLEELSHLLQDLLGRLECLNDDFAYNYVLQTAPYPTRRLPDFHWHLEILPRMTGLGGFELGTGMFINILSPEVAAERIRQANMHT